MQDPIVGPTVASPCVLECGLDADAFCRACGRHVDDISSWRKLSESQRLEARRRAKERIIESKN